MILTYIGGAICAFGVAMVLRAAIYMAAPTSRMAVKRKRRNLKLGFTTDMRVFGRKVLQVGLFFALLGAFVIGWQLSGEAEETGAPVDAAPAADAPPSE